MKTAALVSMLFVATLAWAGPVGEGAPLKGRVLETADGGAYIYLRLDTPQGEIWAATTKQAIAKGAQIVIHDPMLMTNFQSKALNRSFDQIVFASAVSVEGQSETMATQMKAAHRGAATETADLPVGKIGKASGAEGRTVAEVHAQKAKLAGKPVVVRGKVVKFSQNILGRNWIHLRDGTGVVANGDNDLLVTTDQVAKVGDVVVTRGVVRTEADFGSGYSYAVVLEKATLQL
jgi:hypothetical protein